MRGLTSILTTPLPFPLILLFRSCSSEAKGNEEEKKENGETRWGNARGDCRGDDLVVVTLRREGTRKEEKMEESEG